jgi:cytochrome c-type biogenesis protein CcmH/NrfG
MQDYYEVLQVHPKADQESIHAAYERLCARYDPDALEGAADELVAMVREKREAVERAYAVLGNAKSRAAYDNDMRDLVAQPAHASKPTASSRRKPAPATGKGQDESEDDSELLIDYRPLSPARREERPRDFETQPYLTMQQALAQEREGGRRASKIPYWGVPVGVTAVFTFLTVFVTVLIAGVGAPRVDPSTVGGGQNSRGMGGMGMQNMPPEVQAAHQYGEQIQAARQVVQQVPDNPKAWINLGDILFDSVQMVRERLPNSETYDALVDRWLEASEAYQKALELEPDNARVRSDLAVCLCNYGSDMNKPDYVERGLTEARRAAAEGPDNGRVLLNLGTCLVRTEPPQTQEALEQWRKILQLPDVQQNITVSAERLIAQYSQSQ